MIATLSPAISTSPTMIVPERSVTSYCARALPAESQEEAVMSKQTALAKTESELNMIVLLGNS
ncbi:MAG: hypothetical protein CMJ72_12250 [Planctomycetaceae bacterium]|nr:hypothetical protein [Planctomycetaceae bacterium]MCH2596760.1 hypothetical protein [Pirellulales bacterium]HCK42115.1 hypothetical protein [Planctomycetaceae bacterium]